MSVPEWLGPLAFSAAFTLTSMWVPVWLGVRSATRRSHFWGRVGLIALVACAEFATALVAPDVDSTTITAMLTVDKAYAAAPLLIFALLPLVVLFLYDVTPGDAMYVSAQGYALQNLASGFGETLRLLAGAPMGGVMTMSLTWALISLALYAATYMIFFALILPRRSGFAAWRATGRGMVVAMALVMFLVIFFDEIIKGATVAGLGVPYLLSLRAVHVGTCLFVLWAMFQMAYAQEMRLQMEAERSIRSEEERRWEMSRQNVEAINIKCHDIRHQIRSLREGGAAVDASALADIEHEVEVYDSLVRTGNAALDTVLSEKRLICDQAGIELSVMADGAALAFMPPADLYALFGNALDNAIRAAREVDPASGMGRYISVVVRRAMGMVTIHVENSFAGPAPQVVDGLPQTTKADKANHGFGMLSMRRIAERYHGSLTASCQGQVFSLDVLLAPAVA